ncbi:hypothetical protein Cni_G10385 [Canna indica]|uniref:Uncharacterized protein n=1 Tax=Canna indica TaxID=4628 RepID=A0AAQ3K452_9LILI|nr:hypothetical protein Cni_G10385 [Canna indica]
MKPDGTYSRGVEIGGPSRPRRPPDPGDQQRSISGAKLNLDNPDSAGLKSNGEGLMHFTKTMQGCEDPVLCMGKMKAGESSASLPMTVGEDVKSGDRKTPYLKNLSKTYNQVWKAN